MQRVPTRSHRGRRGAAVLVALALGLGFIAQPSSAAPVDVSAPVTSGEIDLNGLVTDLTGVVFQGTIDDETGEMTGTLLFPPSDPIVVEDAAPGIDAELTVRITSTPGTGTIDPVTGVAAFDIDVLLELLTLAINGAPVANFTPCNYEMALALTGSLDLETNLLTLGQDPFAVTAAAGNVCGGLGGAIDPILVSEANSLTAVIDLNQEVEPPPVTPDPPPVAPPAAPPAAAPPAAQPAPVAPTFTG